jgi:hypothetical protein
MKLSSMFAVLTIALSAAACTSETGPVEEPTDVPASDPAKKDEPKQAEETKAPAVVAPSDQGLAPRAANNPLYHP